MKTPALQRAHAATNPRLATDYLGMNCQMPPFDDVRVRQAFNYAINKRSWSPSSNGAASWRAACCRRICPATIRACAATTTIRSRRARCWRQARFAHDSSPTLWFRGDQTAEMLAESIQQDLALVGVNVALKPVAWGPLLEAIGSRKTSSCS